MVMLLSLLALLMMAAGFDLHRRRIPNAIQKKKKKEKKQKYTN